MRNKARALIALGALLLLAALALTGYNLYDEYRAGREAMDVLAGMELVLPELTPEPSDAPEASEAPEPEPTPYSSEMPTILSGGYEYIGVLELPALGLKLPVMADWDYTRLRSAPCRYVGSAYTGDLVICGHNYRSHFGLLNTLSAGDGLSFTDAAGRVFSYAVAEVEILQPTAIEEMVTGGWDLTLFTCTLGGQTRVTVRCNEI